MRLVRNTKNAALALTDCEPNVFLFDIPKDSISSVIFGMQCTEGLQKEIQDLIRGEEELNSVKLFKAYMDRKSYKIQTYEIS